MADGDSTATGYKRPPILTRTNWIEFSQSVEFAAYDFGLAGEVFLQKEEPRFVLPKFDAIVEGTEDTRVYANDENGQASFREDRRVVNRSNKMKKNATT